MGGPRSATLPVGITEDEAGFGGTSQKGRNCLMMPVFLNCQLTAASIQILKICNQDLCRRRSKAMATERE